MLHFDHDGAQRLFKLIKNTVSVFLFIALFFTLEYIFDIDFVCSCTSGLYKSGILYMMGPPLILTLLLNFIEPFHQKRTFSTRSCWRLCSRCCSSFDNCCGHVFKMVTRYFGLLTVWASAVLLDGNWYFCLKTNHNISQTGLPCKGNLSYNETRIKDAYKTESLNIGFAVISFFLILWNLLEIRGVYCRKNCCTKCLTCDCFECSPYYVVAFEEILAEQVSIHLNDELEKIAKRKAKIICKKHLNTIENNPLLFSNTGERNPNAGEQVLDTWKTISDFNFYRTEKTPENSPNRSAETPPERYPRFIQQ